MDVQLYGIIPIVKLCIFNYQRYDFVIRNRLREVSR